jgi:hypothetical protein
VFFVWAGLVGALLLAAVCVLRGRRLAFARTLLGAYVVLPPVVQAAYIHGGGLIWQGRYALPLFVCLCVGIAAVLDQSVRPSVATVWLRRLTLVTAVALAAAGFYAFEFALRRYSVGPDGSLKAFLVGTPSWAPPGGVPLWLLLAAALSAVGAWLLTRAVRRGTEQPVLSPRPEVVPSA